jgi:hypothetical protein
VSDHVVAASLFVPVAYFYADPVTVHSMFVKHAESGNVRCNLKPSSSTLAAPYCHAIPNDTHL